MSAPLVRYGLMVRDARRCRAPHHEGPRPHPEELAKQASRRMSHCTGKCASTTASQVHTDASRGRSATARTSWQASDESVDDTSAHGCDRVWDVAFRPQWGIL